VHRGQKGPNQHYQQIDFHVFPRLTSSQQRSQSNPRSKLTNDSGVIKDGGFEVTA
jgi:hypothetical protein